MRIEAEVSAKHKKQSELSDETEFQDLFIIQYTLGEEGIKNNYSRILVARILMALYHGYFELILKPLTKKNPTAADIIVFGIISGDFLFIFVMVCCVYSLESPR